MKTFSNQIQTNLKHKKATSNFHHINHHYNNEKQDTDNRRYTNNIHKRAKSFSKDVFKHFGNIESNREIQIQKINKQHEQYFSQLLKPSKKLKLDKNHKDHKDNSKKYIKDREYIKSQSQSKKNKKLFKLELRPAKSSPDKSHSKSAKRLRNLKQQKSCKLKSKQVKQVSRDKKSKDSKQSSKNSKSKKSQSLNIQNKIQKRRQLQNILGRDKKGIEINFKNISLKQRQRQINQLSFPLTTDQISQKYRSFFNETQINQMKQYKYIYFLGKRNVIQLQNKQINSAREKYPQHYHNGENEEQFDYGKQYKYYETENLSPQKHKQQEENTQFYSYEIGDHIAYRYQIISSINRGSFGEVLKVLDHKTGEHLAIKVVKKSKELVQQTFVEISILTQIKENDKGNTSGIVRIKDFLLFRNHICIIFELLDGNLYELLTANKFKGFSDDIIRVFAVQILNSLNFLKRQKIIHCDLKPQNLVMKNWGKSGIKLIDFGTSCFSGKQMYSYIQSRYYRAPEVIMQMPYSFPIDMWSFGCMIAEFKLGQPLFSGKSSIQQLIYICSCIGLPNKHDGLFSLAYLENSMLKEIIEKQYLNQKKEINSLNQNENNFVDKYQRKLKRSCMLNLQKRLQKKSDLNPHFLSFLKGILTWQPQKRLNPQQALRHPWITKGLSSQIFSLYSNFNTVESCSKSKKNSKDSKKSNQSQKKSSRKKSSKAKNQEMKVEIMNSQGLQNKINFQQKGYSNNQATLLNHQKHDNQDHYRYGYTGRIFQDEKSNPTLNTHNNIKLKK